jgi:diguanylate cyclase (GGDEF)-like protein/PAS domain S-box-containing protein
LSNVETSDDPYSIPFSTLENFPKLLEIFINRLNDAIVITEAEPIDKPGPRIVWANKVFFERNGYTPEEIIGQSPRLLQGELTDRATLDKIRAALEKWQTIRAETLNYRKDGSTYWNEFDIVPVANEKGWFTHWISVQRDITERKLLALKLEHQANEDYLTGVNNRRHFMKLAELERSRSVRYGSSMALLMLDIDFFKIVNDTHGHRAGDAVLIKLAEVCKLTIREVDTIGRIGGEEFAILLPETDQARATEVAERIRVALADTEVTSECVGSPIRFTVSIGVASLTSEDESIDVLLNAADKALYIAKETGRNKVCVAI